MQTPTLLLPVPLYSAYCTPRLCSTVQKGVECQRPTSALDLSPFVHCLAPRAPTIHCTLTLLATSEQSDVQMI